MAVLSITASLILTLLLGAAVAEAGVITPYLIGGKVVDISKHPYLVSLRYQLHNVDGAYWHMCAGIIYTERVVITAAQCIHTIPTDRIVVVAGGNRRTGGDGMLYPATKWVAHPNFSAATADYDIGIVIVELPFDLQHSLLRSINIYTQRPTAGKVATVPGWGYREEFGPSAYNLEEINVPIVSTATCERVYGRSEVTERMVCAGYMDIGGRDACQGDTGGPLVYDGALLGLVSWGRGCARPGYPTVYTYVASLKQWLDETIEANV